MMSSLGNTTPYLLHTHTLNPGTRKFQSGSSNPITTPPLRPGHPPGQPGQDDCYSSHEAGTISKGKNKNIEENTSSRWLSLNIHRPIALLYVCGLISIYFNFPVCRISSYRNSYRFLPVNFAGTFLDPCSDRFLSCSYQTLPVREDGFNPEQCPTRATIYCKSTIG